MMEKRSLLNTREAAEFLDINEKMVYTLINEKGLPATKITGKWLFPRHLIEKWLENQTINYPDGDKGIATDQRLLIVSGSNDILLERTLSLFRRLYPDYMASFANLGSVGGLKALNDNICHIATSHLLHDNEAEYNFLFAREELRQLPGVVNFCLREQGILLEKGNPKKIQGIADLGRPGLKIVNRPVGTGTRLLLDRELTNAGIEGDRIEGYQKEMTSHMDVGLEVLRGRADAGPAIQTVARLLDLDFLPLRWERFDLLIQKKQFFEKRVQLFLGLLHEKAFRELADDLTGYDLKLCGKMVFPQEVSS
ncbi:substrate-binding domain-containing protein [Thermodesulfobacteriota bacterium]